jgi:hypothetical protein
MLQSLCMPWKMLQSLCMPWKILQSLCMPWKRHAFLTWVLDWWAVSFTIWPLHPSYTSNVRLGVRSKASFDVSWTNVHNQRYVFIRCYFCETSCTFSHVLGILQHFFYFRSVAILTWVVKVEHTSVIPGLICRNDKSHWNVSWDSQQLISSWNAVDGCCVNVWNPWSSQIQHEMYSHCWNTSDCPTECLWPV